MTVNDKLTISILENLVEVCKDGEQGFKNAGDDTYDGELKKILHDFAAQRENFMIELKTVLRELGVDVDFSGSFLGIMHRRWMDIKFAVAGSNSESILKECLRGEKVALEKYLQSLNYDLPVQVKHIIEKQYVEIQKVSSHITELIERYALTPGAIKR